MGGEKIGEAKFAEKLERIRVGEEMKGLALVTKAAHSPLEV